MKKENINIGFAGMTHLGINSMVATAERGFNVIGYDENDGVVQRLQQQDLPIVEPDLPEMLHKNLHRIQFSSDLKILQSCDIVYISTDVPTDDQGRSDLSGIEQLIARVIHHLGSNAILVILCQVAPGFTRKLQKHIALSRVYYQVETLVFGRAIDRALNPERFIVGCEMPHSSMHPAYEKLLLAFNCPLLPMRYESAELAKISINCCLVASVSVANTLSEICENIGADWSEIAPALKLDKRIGPSAYLSPGLGIAGGNLERDLTTILNLSDLHGTDTSVVAAWVKNSQHRRDWVLRALHEHVLSLNSNSDPVITVLGLAYKENTHSTKNSPSLALLKSLTSFTVNVYDPIVPASVVPHTRGADSAVSAMAGSDVLVIMTAWPEFRTLDPSVIAQKMRGRVIIDPYQMLDKKRLHALGFKHLTLGVK